MQINSRPRILAIFLYSSSVKLCSAMRSLVARSPIALFLALASKQPKVKLSIHSAKTTCVLDHVGPLRSVSL